MLADNCHELQANLKDVIKVMVQTAKDETVSTQIRLNACDMAMRHCYRMTEQVDIIKRLEVLERNSNSD